MRALVGGLWRRWGERRTGETGPGSGREGGEGDAGEVEPFRRAVLVGAFDALRRG